MASSVVGRNWAFRTENDVFWSKMVEMQFSELFVYSTNMKHQNRIQIFGRNTDTLSFCPQFSFKLKRDQKNLLSPNVLQAAKNGFEADILMRPESRALANFQPGSQPEKLLAILPLSKNEIRFKDFFANSYLGKFTFSFQFNDIWVVWLCRMRIRPHSQ